MQSALAAANVQQICAPPCSPDLNPIERCFGAAVTVMEKQCAGNVAILNTAQLRILSEHAFCEAATQSADMFIRALPSAWTNVIMKKGGNTFKD